MGKGKSFYILKKADIYLLDEPTTNLSIEISKLFLDLLLKIKSQKIILVISHDENVINKADIEIKMLKNEVSKKGEDNENIKMRQNNQY